MSSPIPAAAKIIAVVGATGTQGRSVAETFLTTPGWRVRALTRDPDSSSSSSSAASSLRAAGAELVRADLDDRDSLAAAFRGASAVFVNTDFWETYRRAGGTTGRGVGSSPADPSAASGGDVISEEETNNAAARLAYETETRRGRNAADAAAQVVREEQEAGADGSKRPATLERYVYSALGPMRRHSGGKYASLHWPAKADVVDYIDATHASAAGGGALAGRVSYVYMGAYATNPFLRPTSAHPATGAPMAVLPCPGDTMRMPIIDAARSAGPFVRALVLDEPAGARLLAHDRDSYLSAPEYLALWAEAKGLPPASSEGAAGAVALVQVGFDALRAQTGIPREILEGPAYVEEFGYMGGVEGWIGPDKLRKPVETASYAEFLQRLKSEGLL